MTKRGRGKMTKRPPGKTFGHEMPPEADGTPAPSDRGENRPAAAPNDPFTISAAADTTAGGNLLSATLVVREFFGNFLGDDEMTGTGTNRTGSIRVPAPGKYDVTVTVRTAAGTTWEAAAAVGGVQRDKSGTRTAPGNDAWFTTVTVP